MLVLFYHKKMEKVKFLCKKCIRVYDGVTEVIRRLNRIEKMV